MYPPMNWEKCLCVNKNRKQEIKSHTKLPLLSFNCRQQIMFFTKNDFLSVLKSYST